MAKHKVMPSTAPRRLRWIEQATVAINEFTYAIKTSVGSEGGTRPSVEQLRLMKEVEERFALYLAKMEKQFEEGDAPWQILSLGDY